MPGPAPTPATALPPGGRKGRAPKCPYELGDAGATWWRWAWKTPQASQWDTGSHYLIGRRAQLEDSLAALDQFDPYALGSFFDGLELGDPDKLRDALTDLGYIIGRLQALAGGRLAIVQKMAELDDRLGLNPRALAALKWAVTNGKPKAEGGLNEILAQAQKRQREAEAAAG